MAVLDGEMSPLPEKQIKEHIEQCADCSAELEQQKFTIGMMEGKNRRSYDVDILTAVASITELQEGKPKHPEQLWPFIVFGLVLLANKLIEVLPYVSAGMFVKLMSLMIVFMFFGLIRQNPFTLVTNPLQKGELRK